jgi:hypothetical protein
MPPLHMMQDGESPDAIINALLLSHTSVMYKKMNKVDHCCNYIIVILLLILI